MTRAVVISVVVLWTLPQHLFAQPEGGQAPPASEPPQAPTSDTTTPASPEPAAPAASEPGATGSTPAESDAGDEAEPGWVQSKKIEDIDLGALLSQPIRSGQAGSFGAGLESFLFDPYIHAYTTFDWVKQEGAPNTFDAHYFNVFVGMNVGDLVIPEIQLEHEHGSEEIAVRYAQVDVKVFKDHYVRAGLWLVPFGIYNEFLYPEYLTVLPRGPLVLSHRHVVPVAWNDVGLQFRGTTRLGSTAELDYALYISNGLEQADDPDTPEVESGGPIRSLRGNYRDRNHGDKAFGGRIGITPIKGVTAGVSGYSGVYTTDGEHRITLVGGHAAYDRDGITVRVEGAYSIQEAETEDLKRWGTYARAAYAITPWLQPAIGFDIMRLDASAEEDKWGILGGINFRPRQKVLPTLIVRVAGGHYVDDGADPGDDIVMGQLTVGF